jgi:glutamate 5-kinase
MTDVAASPVTELPVASAEPSAARAAIATAKTIVVKVGSSSLTTSAGGLDRARLDSLVDAVAARRLAGSNVVLVSSGAIAAGLAPLGLSRRPRDLASQQAAAAVGQQLLAEQYAGSFARFGLTVGQVLLTSDDVVRRAHYRNAQRTFAKLLGFGVVPVVNENDTVATTEIRFGDNDRLAALVAHLVGADALVLLSDVDALYTGDPRLPGSTRIAEVDDDAALAGIEIATSSSDVGTGGMGSKLTAAVTATGAGIPVLLASAAHAAAALTTRPSEVGTAFAPALRRTSARLFWLRHAANSSGVLLLDAGAVAAVIDRRKSLLPAGIIGYTGEFESGDVVDLVGPDAQVVARGFVGHDSAELTSILGRSLAELPAEHRHAVVHADDLVRIELSKNNTREVGT